jgi:hypothetical protein
VLDNDDVKTIVGDMEEPEEDDEEADGVNGWLQMVNRRESVADWPFPLTPRFHNATFKSLEIDQDEWEDAIANPG